MIYKKHKTSSETMCQTSFSTSIPLGNKLEKLDFGAKHFFVLPQEQKGSYLAGLIESDGCIIVPHKTRTDKGSKLYPSIQICFHLKDEPLAKAIQLFLSSGSIQRNKRSVNNIKKLSESVTLSINSLEGLRNIITYVNGQMRTSKINKLYDLIDWLNAYHPNLFNQKQPKLVIDTSSLVTNAWFSGFAEGDGSFDIRATRGLRYRRTAISFVLEQSQSTENIQVIMGNIAREITLSNVKAICQNKKWRVRSHSLAGHANLIAYFEKYPLQGIKIQDYLDWRTVYQIIKNKEHLHEEGFARIERIKSGMNNKRILTTKTSDS